MMKLDQSLNFAGKKEVHRNRVWVGVYYKNFGILGLVCGTSKNGLNEEHIVIVLFKL